jgi:hypothetical protein
MKNQKLFPALFCAALTLFFVLTGAAQTQPLLKRVNSKTQTVDFGAGGTLILQGAPVGSIVIEGWAKTQIEISSEIEVQAETEADLAALSKVTGYTLNTTNVYATVTSVVPDKKSLKQIDKKFNKALLTMPVRIDYHIKVPLYIDLDINGGDGNLSVSGTLGSMDVKFVKTNAYLALNSGLTNATFGSGTVDVVIPNYRWAGRFVGIQLASGTLNVQLPNSLSAEVEAKILRTGKIENSYTRFKPAYQSVPFTDKFMDARVGAGGVSMKYSVGDGTLNFLETKK